MVRRILVTLDGSEFAEAALPAAAGIARKCVGQLRLLSVQDSGWALVNGEWRDAGRGEARRYLQRTAELVGPTGPDLSTRVREGYVADEILLEADEFGADLIVMATHGRGPLSRFWLGSVANQVVRRAHRPVLLVRPRAPGAPRRAGALAVRRVVVPLDGSNLAEAALTPAMELADRFGSPMTLLRIVQEHAAPMSALIPETFDLNARMVGESGVEASADLQRLAGWMREWGIEPVLDVRVRAEMAPAIVEAAAGDLIVMATHARTGLNRAFLGSVTDEVIRSATGPVLVIPPEPKRAEQNCADGSVGRFVEPQRA